MSAAVHVGVLVCFYNLTSSENQYALLLISLYSVLLLISLYSVLLLISLYSVLLFSMELQWYTEQMHC